jgi:hypothetical protein
VHFPRWIADFKTAGKGSSFFLPHQITSMDLNSVKSVGKNKPARTGSQKILQDA